MTGQVGLPSSPLVRRVMQMARCHLGMEVGFIAELSEGKQNYRVVDGAGESFGLRAGGADPIDETFCNLMLQGEIPTVIPDASDHARLSRLGMTARAGIGSYIGIPLRHSDGTLYGTFCCLSHAPNHSLSDADSAWMSMLAALLTDEVDAQRELDLQHQRISRIIGDQRVTTALQPIIDLATGRCLGVEALSRFGRAP